MIISFVHRFLETHVEKKAYLLIFDNAEKMPDLPNRGNGAIILTSRERLSANAFLSLEQFNEKEAVELFEKIFKRQPDEFALQIAKALDFYPLALTQAYYYIQQTPGMNTRRYCALLTENQELLVRDLRPIGRYQASIAATWGITLQKLKQDHPDALEWLQMVSFLSPEGIPTSWIELYLEEWKSEINSYTRQIRKSDLLKILCDRALIRYDETDDLIRIHRFEQDVIKASLSQEEKTKSQGRALNLIRALSAKIDPMKIGDWGSFMVLKPHIYLLAKECPPSLYLSKVLEKLGNWEYCMGHSQEAVQLLEKVLAIRQQKRSIEDNFTEAMILSAEASQNNNPIEASNFFQMAFMPNAPNPVLAQSLDNLGNAWSSLGENKGVEFFQQTLQMYRSVYSEKNHPMIAKALNNVGTGWFRRGEFSKAIDYHDQALKMFILLMPKDEDAEIVPMLNRQIAESLYKSKHLN